MNFSSCPVIYYLSVNKIPSKVDRFAKFYGDHHNTENDDFLFGEKKKTMLTILILFSSLFTLQFCHLTCQFARFNTNCASNKV